MSFLGRVYQSTYESLCGKHPTYRPWHFQWLFLRTTLSWQRQQMQTFHGRVLDVGCGDKPYASWVDLERVTEYVGLDVETSADITVHPDENWPIPDETFDCVLFTQVLEHLGDRDHVISEIKRILKPGGRIVVTVPFLFPVHGEPYDYARFTHRGLEKVFNKDFIIKESKTSGGFGTVLVSLMLTWIDGVLNTNSVTRAVKGVMLPVWICFSLVLNIVGVLLDCLDTTHTHYANACMIAERK